MFKFIERRAESIVNDIKYGIHGNKILDIGSGGCDVVKKLMENNFDVTPLDIKNKSFIKTIKPILYDGTHMPFEDNSFDTALLIFVMHHTKDPVELLKEAKRVSKKRLIVKEDIYRNKKEKIVTYISDSFVNLEFFGHPHSNKTDLEWKELFIKLDLNLIATKYDNSSLLCFPFYHGTYFLDKT